MTIRYPAILDLRATGEVAEWTERDSAIYALGIGLPTDMNDPRQLAFVAGPSQIAVPTMAAVLVRAGQIPVAAMGVEYGRLLHVGQEMTWHRNVPATGAFAVYSRVANVLDKGESGALITTEMVLRNAANAEPVATVRTTVLARCSGGFGAPHAVIFAPRVLPDRAPDHVVTIATRPEQALLYRLSGDLNPIHTDPRTANIAGFARPILHGLCTYGIACRVILGLYCDFEPQRLTSLATRFSEVVFPGDELAFDLWQDGEVILFQARVPGRDAIVLKQGIAELCVPIK